MEHIILNDEQVNSGRNRIVVVQLQPKSHNEIMAVKNNINFTQSDEEHKLINDYLTGIALQYSNWNMLRADYLTGTNWSITFQK